MKILEVADDKELKDKLRHARQISNAAHHQLMTLIDKYAGYVKRGLITNNSLLKPWHNSIEVPDTFALSGLWWLTGDPNDPRTKKFLKHLQQLSAIEARVMTDGRRATAEADMIETELHTRHREVHK